MARITRKRVRRSKRVRGATVASGVGKDWLVVATNDDYQAICEQSVKDLMPKVRSRVRIARLREKPPKAKTDASSSVVGVSRLADLNDEVVESLKAANVDKQIVFIRDMPVEAMTSRLMALKIRKSGRLHIASKANKNLEAQLIQRLIGSLTESADNQPIVDAWIEENELVLLSASFDRMAVPHSKLVRFLGDERADFERFEIDEVGCFIYWAHADVHLGWKQLEQLIDPTKAIKDQEKTNRFKTKYGQAIRTLRELAGLKQSEIHGLTDRQLRRIEHGELMASTKALKSLASAHRMEIAEYMSRLAALVSAS